jgi:hypothetical protein
MVEGDICRAGRTGDELGPIILREEFDNTLNRIQNGKAAGIDDIYIELIKHVNQ